MRHLLHMRVLFLLLIVLSGHLGAARAQAESTTDTTTVLPVSSGLPTSLPGKEEAAKPKRGAAWFFRGLEIQGGTNLPASVGGGLILYFPAGLYLGNSFGVMPSAYVKLINKVLVAGGEYDQATADLIEKALTNSFVYDLYFGWDPGKPGGFTFNVGYELMTMGGRASTLAVISKATGKKLGAELTALTSNTVPVKTMLHNVTARLGYKLVIVDHLTFDFYVGVLKTVAAKSDIQLAGLGRNRSTHVARALVEYDREINRYMRSLYVHYIVSPLVIVNIGYRFW